MPKETKPAYVIIMLDNGDQIRGQVNLADDALGIDRVSDLLKKGESDFITVFNASIVDRPYQDVTLIIGKRKIEWVLPDEGGVY